MKVLILILLLACLMSTMAVTLRHTKSHMKRAARLTSGSLMKLATSDESDITDESDTSDEPDMSNESDTSHESDNSDEPDTFNVSDKSDEQDTVHQIANAVNVLDSLDVLANDEEANKQYWQEFFQQFDVDGEEGLSKDEFHEGIEQFTINNGFGHQSRPGTDAIWDDLNTNKDNVLSLEEVLEGSQSIFEWYRNIIQNVFRGLGKKLAKEQEENRCDDVKATLEGFRKFPHVIPYIARSWDEDGNGTVSKKEVKNQNAVLMSMLYLEPLTDNEIDELYDELDTEDKGELSYEDAAKFVNNYLDAVVDRACKA